MVRDGESVVMQNRARYDIINMMYDSTKAITYNGIWKSDTG